MIEMVTATDKVIECKEAIAELNRQLADADDIAQVSRLRSVLQAKRLELQRLRRRSRA